MFQPIFVSLFLMTSNFYSPKHWMTPYLFHLRYSLPELPFTYQYTCKLTYITVTVKYTKSGHYNTTADLEEL